MTHLFTLATSGTTTFETSGDAGGVFAGLMVVFLAFAVFGLAATVFWIWMLVDAIKAPDAAWDAVGQSKVLWIILAVFLGVIISLVHFFWLRPKLKAVANY